MPDLNFLETAKPKKEAPVKKRGFFSFAKTKKRTVGVNLITSEVQKEVARAVIRKNGIQLVVSLLIALILALLVYGGVIFVGSREAGRVATLRGELDRVEADIARLERENKRLLGFQSKLTLIKSLLDSHRTLLPFFNALQDRTLPEVSYDSLALTSDGSASLSAGTSNYTALGRQLLAFERASDLFAAVRFSGITASLDQLGDIIGVRFTVSLTLNKNLLSAPPSE